MILTQTFQNSLHLIEETPERFNLAVGEFNQRHSAIELLQFLARLGIDDRQCVVLAVICAIEAAGVKLLTNPSICASNSWGCGSFFSIPSIGRVNIRNFIGSSFVQRCRGVCY